jgi:hypothetical protein
LNHAAPRYHDGGSLDWPGDEDLDATGTPHHTTCCMAAGARMPNRKQLAGTSNNDDFFVGSIAGAAGRLLGLQANAFRQPSNW